MKKLVIYLADFNGGGAERMHLNLAPEFIRQGFEVVFVVHQVKGDLVREFPKDIRLVSLNCERTFSAILPLAKFLKAEKPDVLISNLGHNNVIAVWAKLLAASKTKVIATQHNTLSKESATNASIRYRMLPFLYRHFLKYADAIVGVSKGVTEDMKRLCGFQDNKLCTIYNPIVGADFNQRMDAPVKHIWLDDEDIPVFIAVGRLSDQKDFPTLLRAFAILRKKRSARLMIVGEGNARQKLEQLARELGIANSIELTGFQLNPLPYIKGADVLVMSSLYEGFGNVLVEALACGTPVVSTDCISGPGEILEGGTYGKLVPVGDAQAMADAMLAVLDSPVDHEALKRRGLQFSVKNSADQYVALMNRLMGA